MSAHAAAPGPDERSDASHAFTLSARIVLLAIACGVIGSVGAAAFREGLFLLEQLLHGKRGHLVEAAQGLSWWYRLLFPCIGGVVAGLILKYGNRWSALAQHTDYLEVIALGKRALDVPSSLVRSLSSMTSVASGGSIGREGAMVQVSAVAGHLLTRLARSGADEYRLLVACAAAAGLATAYNAPLAGAIFVGEIALGSQALSRLVPVLLASVTGNALAQVLFGSAPLFTIPALSAGGMRQAPAWIACGVIAGVVAPLMLRLLAAARSAFQRLPESWPLRLGLGGLLVGAISIHMPAVWGNGYSVVEQLLLRPSSLGLLAQLLVLKAVATSMTRGSGAVGGMLTPTLLMGAALGQLAGLGGQSMGLIPSGLGAGYAALGMGAFLTGTTHAPLMAILMVTEMTAQQGLTLPLALSCIAAYLTTKALGSRSIYDRAVSMEVR